MFDVRNKYVVERGTTDFSFSPLHDLVFKEILMTERIFDTEYQPSVDVLNEAADTIASSMQQSSWFKNIRLNEPLVKGANSRDIEIIQAADMAAVWAGDILELQCVRALASTFRRVIVNGHFAVAKD
jgi:hypothetical protein